MALTSTFAQYNAPNQTGSKPVYSGLMGGKYDDLQKNLAVKGAQSATNAYNTGTRNLNNTMGGKGLYGSSIMGQQQVQGLDREYMNAMSANEAQAAATRYQLEQSDQQKAADLNMQGYGIDTAANTARAGLLSNEGIALLNNDTQRYGTDVNAQTAANNLAGQIGMNTANNTNSFNINAATNTANMGMNTANNTSRENINTANNTNALTMNTADNSARNYAVDQGFLGTKYSADNSFNMNAANNTSAQTIATGNNTSAQTIATGNNTSAQTIATGNNTTAKDVAATNATASNYTADQQRLSNAARDTATLDQADIVAATNRYGIDMTSATAGKDLAARIKAAQDAGNMALANTLINAATRIGLDLYSYA